MRNPLVSICIPNFNNARYLDCCIQSALAQTYRNVEVVFTDDASTDNSLEIAQRYESQIRVISNTRNIGQPLNTNRCIEFSRGEYLVILHSDDALLPHCVDHLVKVLDRHPNAGMAAGERLEMDEAGQLTTIAAFYDRDCIVPGEKQAKVFMMAAFVPCQVLVRRRILEAIGGVNKQHVVNLDGLLWFTCALHGDVGYFRTPVCCYRKHSASTTSYYNRTIRHMMEYYGTLSEMFRLGADRPYLKQFFPAAEKRVATLTVRYCHDVLKSRDFALAARYLALATVFDPDIVHSHEYKTLKYCAGCNAADPLEIYSKLMPADGLMRTKSYEPPEGSVQLDIRDFADGSGVPIYEAPPVTTTTVSNSCASMV